MLSDNINLSSGQSEALQTFLESFNKRSPTKSGKIFQIDGPAGTGKTELTRIIIEQLKDKHIIICAPTHKACQVLTDRLRGQLVEILTCHQFLKASLIYTKSGKQQWTFRSKTIDLPDLLILDEVSMIDVTLYTELINLVKNRGLFLLTFGDSCQLPPVGENKTPFYSVCPIHKSLTQNMRNENMDYNSFLTQIRQMILLLENPNYDPNYTNKQLFDLCKPYTDLYPIQNYPNLNKIPKEIIKDYISELNTKNVIMLAHRTNSKTNTVKNLNEKLRKELFPKSTEKFDIGDKLIFTDYFKTSDSVFYTNDIVFVESCSLSKNVFYEKEFLVYKLGINKNKTCLFFLHPSEQLKFDAYHNLIHSSIQNTEELLSTECDCQIDSVCEHRKKIDDLWQEYYTHYKNIFSPVDYAYCLSIHKSQGSTYDKVYLFLSDFVWFLERGDYDNFFKLLYVGVSRTRTNTVLF